MAQIEVLNWLRDTCGYEPTFEINATTIDILHQLATKNKKKNDDCHILLECLQQQTREYKLKNTQLSKILAAMDVKTNTMTNCLSKIATELNLEDVNTRSLISGFSHLQQKQHDTRAEHAAISEQNVVMVSEYEALVQQWRELAKVKGRFQEYCTEQAPLVETRQNALSYLESKSQEYDLTLHNSKVERKNKGECPEIYHNELIEKKKQLDLLQKNSEPILNKLQSFKNLPPDVQLARQTIEKAKLEFYQLEEKLAEKINELQLQTME